MYVCEKICGFPYTYPSRCSIEMLASIFDVWSFFLQILGKKNQKNIAPL